METYVITLSQVFPVTHANAGEPTDFKEKFFNAIKSVEGAWWKYHTIRANYDLWEQRFKKIAAGKARLSVRQWLGKPYRSKQVEIATLTCDDGIGIQKLFFSGKDLTRPFVEGSMVDSKVLSRNDGLSLMDWCTWFRSYDLSKPLVIIHFTGFRY